MKVFMLGWEFPPHISGGLGTACHGLTKGLDEIGVEVSFVLPQSVPLDSSNHVAIRCPNSLAGLERAVATGNDSARSVSASVSDSVSASEVSELIEQIKQIEKIPAAGETASTPHRRDITETAFKHLSIHTVPALLQAYGTGKSFHEEITSLLAKVRTGELPDELSKIITQISHFAEDAKDGDAGSLLAENFGAKNAAATNAHTDNTPEAAAQTHEPIDIGQFTDKGDHYDGDLLGQVHRYARLAVELSKHEDFDVIHAHDWMTYVAGQAVAASSGKPLVVQVHSTEFDRSGENINQVIYDIERAGMQAANRVICVSYLTRSIVINRYGIDESKAEVVYNAVDLDMNQQQLRPITHKEKIVLFLGRVTMQKGPEYFLQAARKVVDKYPSVRFVLAGSGDMVRQCISLAADLKLGSHVTFTGFLRGGNVGKVFAMADLFVMPSVSEPFGIAPLEAISHNVPVIISKQSGVSEVLTHVLKVDFWDIDEMANKILAVLNHEPLQKALRQHGQIELGKLSWKDSAVQLRDIYERVVLSHRAN